MAVDEWDQRQLCPDEACVGVIGPDGTCKVCGRVAPNWGDERNRGLRNASAEADPANPADPAALDDEDAEDGDDDDDEEGDDGEGDDGDDGDDYLDDEDSEDGSGAIRAAPAAPAARGEWAERKLCPDGACIGVIGASGRCKVCGRAADGTAGPPIEVITDPVITDPVSPSVVVTEPSEAPKPDEPGEPGAPAPDAAPPADPESKA